MKKLISFLLLWSMLPFCYAENGVDFAESDFLSALPEGAKAAILMVHFGTSYDDTRAVTIDAINAKVQQEFPELAMYEAYTSRIITKKLAKRGVVKYSPLEMLIRMRAEGVTHVIVQSCHLIDGVEAESLRADVEAVRSLFSEVRIGRSLLYSVEDALQVAEIIGKRHAARTDKKSHVVLMGHGTYTPVTAAYSQLDYMLKDAGYTNFHVATIEGYPEMEQVIAKLKAAKAKHVTLVSFMFVAGDHARNDIAGECKQELEEAGFTVDVHLEGLGEIPEIQDIYLSHVRFALQYRELSIMEKKGVYAVVGEKVKIKQ